MNGDAKAIQNAKRFQIFKINDIEDLDGITCNKMILNNYPTSKKELESPVAFTIQAFYSLEQFLRLFRLIYRPWNYYCIHVDLDAKNPAFQKAVEEIANCFQNVLLPSIRYDVSYGDINVLKASLECFEQLLPYNWTHMLNLAASELPLKSNAELVEALRYVQSTCSS
jgi:hypothetical protein